jgi:hypothetical protein
VLLDLLPVVVYAVTAWWVFRDLWADPVGRQLRWAYQDQNQHEWFLGWGAHAVLHGLNPFVTDLLNAPHGVNLLANTSLLGLAVPLAPLTVTLGTPVAYVTAMTVGLTVTATGWYVVFRQAVDSRLGAALGGAFCGFAPAMLSHANAHVNFTAQVLIPFIVWRTVRLVDRGRSVRNGVLLGLLVAWQVFIGEEILAYTALAVALFLAFYAALRPARARGALRPLLTGLAVTALVAGALLAYPLWMQFRGPYSYTGLADPVVDFANDLAAFPAFLRTDPQPMENYAINAVEQNAHFGWPLVVVIPFLVVFLRRSATAVAAVLVGVLFAALSLGAEVTVAGEPTGVPGPWAVAQHLPLLDHIPPSRLSMVCVPVIGLLLAMTVAELARRRPPVRAVGAVVLLAALAPLVPAGRPTTSRDDVPEFYAGGDVHRYVEDGGTVLPLPVPSPDAAEAYRYQAAAGWSFRLPAGYFLYPRSDGKGVWGVPARPTARLIAHAAAGDVLVVGADERAQARRDLEYWGVDLVVLPLSDPDANNIRGLVSALLAGDRGIRVDDVVVWWIPPEGAP